MCMTCNGTGVVFAWDLERWNEFAFSCRCGNDFKKRAYPKWGNVVGYTLAEPPKLNEVHNCIRREDRKLWSEWQKAFGKPKMANLHAEYKRLNAGVIPVQSVDNQPIINPDSAPLAGLALAFGAENKSSSLGFQETPVRRIAENDLDQESCE